MVETAGGGAKVEGTTSEDAIDEVVLDVRVMSVEFIKLGSIVLKEERGPHCKSL